MSVKARTANLQTVPKSHKTKKTKKKFGGKTNLLDIIVTQCPSILKLLSRENQSLLIRRDALLVLDLCLDIIDRIARFHLEGDGFAREGFHKAEKVTRQKGSVCA